MKNKKLEKIKYVAFDITGVLIDSNLLKKPRNINICQVLDNDIRFQSFLTAIQKLKPISVGIISNTITSVDCFKLKYNRHFDNLIFGKDVGYPKPHPKIFEKYFQETGASPEQVLFVDDKKGNLIYMHSLGVTTVLLHPYKKMKDNYIYAFIDYIFNDWRELLDWLGINKRNFQQ